MIFYDRNLHMLDVVAKTLSPIKTPLAFVGGITTGLYLDEIFIGGVRATDDVDCVVEVASRVEFHLMEEQLRSLGLEHDTSMNAPICRWLCAGIKVGVSVILCMG